MLKRRRGDERGTTLVELMVVVAVMGVILGSLLAALVSGENAQAATEALVANQETVRLALDQMQRDFTAANPVDPLATTSDYADAVQVELGPNPGVRQVIRWYYNTAAAVLYRQVMSNNTPTATVVSQRAMVTNVTNAATGTQMFTYYDAADNPLQQDNPATPTSVAYCAVRIDINISAASDPGPRPFNETLDVELRNRLPGGIKGCISGT